MLKEQPINIVEIYVPVDRRKSFDPEKAEEIAENMLDIGQKTPIQVRQGKDRYVLVEGLHRLEACISLGDDTILAYIVRAKKF